MSLKQYFKKAQKEGWAIGQFNFSTLETLRAIFQAGKIFKSPIIIGTSEKESKFIGLLQAVSLVKSFSEELKIPAFLNLDHGKSLEYIKKAVDLGYNAVHFDGSSLPFKENIKIANKIVEYAHKKNVLVEGEIGVIKGSSVLHKEKIDIKTEDLTDAGEALEFIKKTNIDSLAINIGTFHGMKEKGLNPHINIQRLKEIKEKIGKIPLVLHGGSGTPEEDIKKAIKLGIVKININTELRLALANTLRKVLQENPEEIVPYNILPVVIEAVQKVVEEKIRTFGSANKI